MRPTYLTIVILALSTTVANASPGDSLPIPFSGQISVSAQLSSDSVALGDTLSYTMSIKWVGSSENYMFWPPETPQVTGLEFSHMRTVNQKKSTIDGYESSTQFVLLFVGAEIGESTIGETQVKYVTRGREEFEYLRVQGQAVKVVAPPREFPVGMVSKILFVLVLGGGLGFGYYRIRLQKANAAKVTSKTPDEIAVELMLSTRSRRINGDYAGYYQEMQAAVRGLLVENGCLAVGVRDLDKIQNALVKSEFPESFQDAIASILGECEEMRFSGMEPETHEVDLFESKVKNILIEIIRARAE